MSARVLLAPLVLLLGATFAGCTGSEEGRRMDGSEEARAELSAIVGEVTAGIDAAWTQRAPASTGPCSLGGVAEGLEWADDWDGDGVADIVAALDAGERILRAAGLDVDRSEEPSGGSVHGTGRDGRSILLDIGAGGRALLDARSACFASPPRDAGTRTGRSSPFS